MVEITEEQYEIYEEAIRVLDQVLEKSRTVYLYHKRTKMNGEKEYGLCRRSSKQDAFRALADIKYLVDHNKFGFRKGYEDWI